MLQIERLPDPFAEHTVAALPPLWSRPPRRLWVFVGVMAISLGVGLPAVFLRPPIYQASATLLTTAKPAADQTEPLVDPQHVAIQQVLLTAQPLLLETLQRLEREGQLVPSELTPEDVKTMLAVEPVPDTNLVELRAEGPRPELLAPLVNTWIEVYLEARAREVQDSQDTTLTALREQVAALEAKIAAKRQALDEFRRRYDIASLGRSENETLARLNGLTKTLNQLSEEEVKAKARLDAIQAAVATGEPLVPQEDSRTLAALEARAQALREELTALKQRFTPAYIQLNPQYRKIPKQLKEIEDKIQRLVGTGQKAVLLQAEQDYQSARQAVRETKRQLDQHKRLAAEFSARFAEHEALVEELKQMETRQRELQDRITLLQVKQPEKYPQVEVVERAFRPYSPIRPHYLRDAGLVVAASLGFGIVAVWLVEYLTRRESTLPETRLTLAGVHVYATPEALGRSSPAVSHPALKEDFSPPALEAPFPRELQRKELESLLSSADLRTRQSIALLLSGLTPDEVTRLNVFHLALNQAKLFAPSSDRRTIPLAPRLLTWLAASGGAPLVPSSREELAKLIYLTALEAGLIEPETVTPEAIRHTYLVYLIRQNLRLSELEKVAGVLPLAQLTAYGRLLPPGNPKALEEVERIHPCLKL
jgi:succinoglycan biosynthesis transport protein ExoP